MTTTRTIDERIEMGRRFVDEYVSSACQGTPGWTPEVAARQAMWRATVMVPAAVAEVELYPHLQGPLLEYAERRFGEAAGAIAQAKEDTASRLRAEAEANRASYAEYAAEEVRRQAVAEKRSPVRVGQPLEIEVHRGGGYIRNSSIHEGGAWTTQRAVVTDLSPAGAGVTLEDGGWVLVDFDLLRGEPGCFPVRAVRVLEGED